MAQRRVIRKIDPLANQTLEERLWPVNVALAVLASFLGILISLPIGLFGYHLPDMDLVAEVADEAGHGDAEARWRAGFVNAPVTDWRNYDSIYTERYMATPQNNPEGYAASSVVAAAANLRGKLLLIHGTTDDNVHLQNTMQLVYALQKAGKPFQLMLYPRSRHAVTEPELLKHLRQTMTDFITTNL